MSHTTRNVAVKQDWPEAWFSDEYWLRIDSKYVWSVTAARVICPFNGCSSLQHIKLKKQALCLLFAFSLLFWSSMVIVSVCHAKTQITNNGEPRCSGCTPKVSKLAIITNVAFTTTTTPTCLKHKPQLPQAHTCTQNFSVTVHIKHLTARLSPCPQMTYRTPISQETSQITHRF